ncbi:MAG: hypothetical protein D6715_11515 [Calditrichaeota bacterium]|nr:MAG: hypothetical protein D6715_11515 [Calditrichota bacterium]
MGDCVFCSSPSEVNPPGSLAGGRFCRLVLFFLLAGLIFIPSAIGRAGPPDHSPASGKKYFRGRLVARAVRTDHPPVIDGRVDNCWLKAPVHSGFLQRTPYQGYKATWDTRFYILYDDHNLYLLFVMLDPEPEQIPARLVERDTRFSPDDNINFYLDTFNDHQRAYFFSTNPLGVEQDGLISDNGRRVDMSWDGVYQVAARKMKYGWVAEFAIPFKILRFDAHRKYQVWGFNVWRMRKEQREVSFWSLVSQDYSTFRLDQGGVLIGLEGRLAAGKHLDFLPYTTSTQRSLAGGQDKLDGKVGFDLRYGLTSDLTMNLTVNPDFGQVEIDEEQINLDKRFELILEEKRPFFLENANLFKVPIRTFYSRRIGAQSDIKLGLKITGKRGPYSLGLVHVATGDWENLGLGDPNNDSPDELFNIVRVQRDVLNNSNIGILLTDREQNLTGNDYAYNRSAGIDWNIFLGRRELFQGHFVYSANSGPGGEGTAGTAVLSHFDRLYTFYLQGYYYDPQFEVNGTGFFPKLPDNGYREVSTFAEIHPLINRKVVRRWGLSSLARVYKNTRDRGTSFGDQSQIFVEFPDQSRLTFTATFFQDVEFDLLERFDQIRYDGQDFSLELNTDTGKPLALRLKLNHDTQYYFQTHTVGFNRGVEGELLFKPISNGFLRFGYQIRQFLDGDRKLMPVEKVGQSNVRLFTLRARYLLSRDLFTRGFVQYTNAAESVDFFLNAQNQPELKYSVFNRLSANFLLGWRYRPGSTIYFAYTQEWDDSLTPHLHSQNRIFFVKFSYLWGF